MRVLCKKVQLGLKPGLQVYKQSLLWGPKNTNRTYHKLLGAAALGHGAGIGQRQFSKCGSWALRMDYRGTQRVQLECHYGIRSPKPYHAWFLQPYFQNGSLIGPSGHINTLGSMYGTVFGTEFHNGTLIGPSGMVTLDNAGIPLRHLDPQQKLSFQLLIRILGNRNQKLFSNPF